MKTGITAAVGHRVYCKHFLAPKLEYCHPKSLVLKPEGSFGKDTAKALHNIWNQTCEQNP